MWKWNRRRERSALEQQLAAPSRTQDPLRSLPAADADIVTDLRLAALAERHRGAGWSLWIIVLLVAACLFWAAHAELDEVTIGSGQVVPSSREQSVQTVDGGVLGEVMVREGDRVERGQVVARMDVTRSGAFYREGAVKTDALRSAAARLRAEAAGLRPRFDAELRTRAPEVVELEEEAFASRARALDAAEASKRSALRLAQDELRLTAPLADKGIVSEVEVLRLRRQVTDLQAQIVDQRNKFRSEAAADLARTETELRTLGEAVTGRADQVRQSTLRAGVSGVVKSVRVASGAVLRPGEEILSLIPTDGALLVDAKIRPSDVAFLRPGLAAKVKISAYDFAIYGAMAGKIESISPDTVADEQRRGETFYLVRVRTDSQALHDGAGKPLPIIPGMTTTVEILNGKRTVLDYLLKPVLKARDALRER
jgi:adhesin transport system membrane fusion protein